MADKIRVSFWRMYRSGCGGFGVVAQTQEEEIDGIQGSVENSRTIHSCIKERQIRRASHRMRKERTKRKLFGPSI